MPITVNNKISPEIFKNVVSDKFALAALAFLCVVEFVLHLRIDGELIAHGPYTFAWGTATGVVQILNGEAYHFEAIANLRNLQFFSGDDSYLDLGYTIPTGRIIFPFVASFFNLFFFDVLNSFYSLNLVLWILAAWAAYGIGKYELRSQFVAIVLGILVATSQGFISKTFGTKTHLSSYAYFLIMIFLANRLEIFHRLTPLKNYIAMGLIVGCGIFINGVNYMMLGYIILMGLFVIKARNLVAIIVVTGGIMALSKVVLLVMSNAGIYNGSYENAVAGNLIAHVKGLFSFFTTGIFPEFDISSGSGSLHYTKPLEPFYWLQRFFPDVIMIGGIPIIVLAVAGIFYISRKELWLSLSILIPTWLVVSLILTYWPWRSFFGYMYYYSVFAFFVLAAIGARNISLFTRKLMTVLGGDARKAVIVARTVAVILLLVQVTYTNQDILLGRQIEHVRFHESYFISFPVDWNFDVLDW